MADGNSRVFDIHLGTTTFKQAQQAFNIYAKTAIFSQENQAASVEAYFDSINLGGLSAKVVLNLSVADDAIPAMQDHATEAKLQPSGARRYMLHSDDQAQLLDAPINTITYIPSVKLNEDMLINRFGVAEKVEQATNQPNTIIWHYPKIGLSIRLSPEDKTVLEYSTIN
ncbi:hypothetical protein A9Q78_00520 [Methylophaga sp. 41_12_T18]|nr:hypothetical protein A9Q78_00520 [Methylophaga sp. 41_12_T18]